MRPMRKRFSSRRRHSEMRLNYRLLSSNSLLREDNYEATERRGYALKGFCAFFSEEGNTCTVIMLLQPLKKESIDKLLRHKFHSFLRTTHHHQRLQFSI